MPWNSSNFNLSNWWASYWNRPQTSSSTDPAIRFKDGQVLMEGGKIAMGEACCCDYTPPPDACVDCPPNYLIGNTAAVALEVTGFVDQDPVGWCCNYNNPFHSTPIPPNCSEFDPEAYETHTYFQFSNYNRTYVLSRTPGDCFWQDLFYEPPNACATADGPVVAYYECWDTHVDPHVLWRREDRIRLVQVGLYESGGYVFWRPTIDYLCCFYKNGVLQSGTSSACDTLVCWEFDDVGDAGVMTVEDFCNGQTSTMTGKQFLYGTTLDGPDGEGHYYPVPICFLTVIGNLRFTLHPAAFTP